MHHWIRSFLLATLLLPRALSALSFGERALKAESRDYVVLQQGKLDCLLAVVTSSGSRLVLEEIDISADQFQKQKYGWKEWVAAGAPGHIAWTLYEVDLEEGRLISAYSCTKQAWLALDPSETILAGLLALPLTRVDAKEQKKIGPPPPAGEPDHRPLWRPEKIFHSRKENSLRFECLRGRWPKDGSLLDSCLIDLYFETGANAFPLPYWVEVQGSSYTFKMRAIDSGKQLPSPTRGMPLSRLRFLEVAAEHGDIFRWTLDSPSTLHPFSLLAVDLSMSSGRKMTLSLPCRCLYDAAKGVTYLEVDRYHMERMLQKGHRYSWIALPTKEPSLFAESETPLFWDQSE